MTKILCIYHAECCDGFAAAWAVWRKFGDGVEFYSAKYGQNPQYNCAIEREPDPRSLNAIVGRDMLIVDFSYPREQLEELARTARSVLVLDHHATAEKDLADIAMDEPPDWDTWLYCIPKEHNLSAVFDQTRSGAGLTWDYLHPAPRPRLIDLVEDHDLWRFAHDPDTRRFHAVAASYGYEPTRGNFERWDTWHDMSSAHPLDEGGTYWLDTLREGEAILRSEAKLVETVLASSRRMMRLAGYVVPVACCPGALASEVGSRLMRTPELFCGQNNYFPDDEGSLRPYFSAIYYDGVDDKRHFSLRSTDTSPFHCGDAARAVAQRLCEEHAVDLDRRYGPGHEVKSWYAGGGHKNAAGFTAPIGWEGE